MRNKKQCCSNASRIHTLKWFPISCQKLNIDRQYRLSCQGSGDIRVLSLSERYDKSQMSLSE